jgi:DNA-binding NarL/FixJ family response regulator
MKKNFQILLGETDVKVSKKIIQVFDSYNITTFQESNALRILKKLSEQSFDLLISIDSYQGMDIIQLMEKMKELNLKIPTVVMLDGVDKLKIARIAQLGVRSFINKNLIDHNVIETIKSVLQLSSDDIIIKNDYPLSWEIDCRTSTEFIPDRGATIQNQEVIVIFKGIPTINTMKDAQKDILNYIFRYKNTNAISLDLPEEFSLNPDSIPLVEELLSKVISSYEIKSNKINIFGKFSKTPLGVKWKKINP